tara:strand:+ start:229 stop:495 length:267 start_codon:yes stop_codon:yes gene_type:complete
MVNDKSKISDKGWHGYVDGTDLAWQIAITRYLKKDAEIKKHTKGASIYFDDVDLVVTADTIMSLSPKGNGDKETVADMKKAILQATIK